MFLGQGWGCAAFQAHLEWLAAQGLRSGWTWGKSPSTTWSDKTWWPSHTKAFEEKNFCGKRRKARQGKAGIISSGSCHYAGTAEYVKKLQHRCRKFSWANLNVTWHGYWKTKIMKYLTLFCVVFIVEFSLIALKCSGVLSFGWAVIAQEGNSGKALTEVRTVAFGPVFIPLSVFRFVSYLACFHCYVMPLCSQIYVSLM